MTSTATGTGIARLLAAYRSGALRPTDVVEQVLAAPSPDGVWISRAGPDELRRRAAELQGKEHLPLYGVPFAVKDNIDVAGTVTTAACPASGYPAARSAPVVERLLEAGAILAGKTNLDQFATGPTGTRSPFGVPRSVLGGGLIAGGSSSGPAVAVAAGLVAFALGTDTAGSGRVVSTVDGDDVQGFLCEAGALDITAGGGWRAHQHTDEEGR
ncbi:amidase family protein [Dactylosporangium salmoneum]|uniref:Amidase domain-containing protein n=1 Tax=Dactylosporangium salmoneum TaxID=53361 RepID=A0ABP5VB99_9ACTN